MSGDGHSDIVRALWREAAGSPVSLRACPVSGNNRVYVAEAPGRDPVIAKFYFPGKTGEPDRLDAEWSFLRHAHAACPGSVPRPLARAVGERAALYEFIEGTKLGPGEVGAAAVAAAADFIAKINRPGTGAELAPAREACFSPAEQIVLVDRRFERLGTIPTTESDATALVREMIDFWSELKLRLASGLHELGIDPARPVPDDERLISPSDFGFHNALVRPDGRIVFIDFEYAGWDDAAKLIADFFHQPAVPVDRVHWDAFVDVVLARVRDPLSARRRVALMRPIFGLKWCCIMLNRFLPEMESRSRFVDPTQDPRAKKAEQYAKARRAFDNLVEEKWHT